MTIGQLARATGVSPSAIRYYESTGVLTKPERRNGMRHYHPKAVDEVKVLRFYRANGISIRGLSAIAKHLEGTPSRRDAWAEVLQKRIDALEREIAAASRARRALKAAVACRCAGNRGRCTVIKAAGASP